MKQIFSVPKRQVPKQLIWVIFICILILSIKFIQRVYSIAAQILPPPVHCISYAPSAGWLAIYNIETPKKSIERDIERIKKITSCIRVYKAGDEGYMVAKIAAQHNLIIYQGVWLDGFGGEIFEDKNDAELAALKKIVNDPEVLPHIKAVVAGNELRLFNRLSDEDTLMYIKEIKKITKKPIAIADVLNPLETEQYASSSELVDIIGLHIFPYWMGQTGSNFDEYHTQIEHIRSLYPKKEILLFEFGWPSAGFPSETSYPSWQKQNETINAITADTKYFPFSNVIEAYDQPKKINLVGDEGLTGAHWGIWDIAGLPKSVSVITNIFASILAGLLIGWCFTLAQQISLFNINTKTASNSRRISSRHIAEKWLWIYAIMASILFAVSAMYLYLEYLILIPGGQLLFVLQFVLTAGVLWHIRMIHLSERQYSRAVSDPGTLPLYDANHQPYISIHIPCAGEDPEVLKSTVLSCIEQEYKAFQIIVGINNTNAEKYSEVHKEILENEIYINRTKRGEVKLTWSDFGIIYGAKSGALNHMLEITDSMAKYIAVLDSDYVAHPKWLAVSISELQKNGAKAVMARQHYRNCNTSLKQAAEIEQELCFTFNERMRDLNNSILLNGTMCLIERKALSKVGGWPEKNICEDAEVGYRLQREGLKVKFIDAFLGAGLAPETFNAYAKQHARWAHGAMYNLRLICIEFFFKDHKQFGFKQLFDYALSWLPWFLQLFLVLFFLGGMFSTYFMFYDFAYFPVLSMLLFPFLSILLSIIFATVISKNIFGYSKRQFLISLVYFIALSPYIADGILSGLIGLNRPFSVTGRKMNTQTKIKLEKNKNLNETPNEAPLVYSKFLTLCKTSFRILRKLSLLSHLFIIISLIEIFFIFDKYGMKHAHIFAWAGFIVTLILPAVAEVYVRYLEDGDMRNME